MTTLEDKILGEKTQYYCDSDEEYEEDEDESVKDADDGFPAMGNVGISNSLMEPGAWEGSSVNTGPKGVLRDWQRYKQLEAEKRESQEAERQAFIKKLSLTCSSHLEDERAKQDQNEFDDLEKDLTELVLEDGFLKEYIQKRMEEMLGPSKHLPTFGQVLSLENGDQYLKCIDGENKNVTVIVHLYEDNVPGCNAMNGCLQCLAQEYPTIKFCKMRASVAGLTKHFKVSGVPALLVYKGGQIVGNFVQLTREFGEDFFAVDVEAFLIENGILNDKTLVPEVIRNSNLILSDHSDSDFELD